MSERNLLSPVILQETLPVPTGELEVYQKRLSLPVGDRIKCQGNKFLLPTGVETREIETVILDFVAVNLYYDRPFRAGEVTSPACYAINPQASMLAPRATVINPQASTCAACPKNEFGSGPTGTGKACRNTRRVAVLSDLSNVETCDVWFLSIPPKSIRPFELYIRELLVKYKVPPYTVVTNISLDPRETYASFKFHLLQPIQDKPDAILARVREVRELLLFDPIQV